MGTGRGARIKSKYTTQMWFNGLSSDATVCVLFPLLQWISCWLLSRPRLDMGPMPGPRFFFFIFPLLACSFAHSSNPWPASASVLARINQPLARLKRCDQSRVPILTLFNRAIIQFDDRRSRLNTQDGIDEALLPLLILRGTVEAFLLLAGDAGRAPRRRQIRRSRLPRRPQLPVRSWLPDQGQGRQGDCILGRGCVGMLCGFE